MVSLINFKIVNEELQQEQQQQQHERRLTTNETVKLHHQEEIKRLDLGSSGISNRADAMFVKVMHHEQTSSAYLAHLKQEKESNHASNKNLQIVSVNHNNNKRQLTNENKTSANINITSNSYDNNKLVPTNFISNPTKSQDSLTNHHQLYLSPHQPLDKPGATSLMSLETRASFVVTWRNLKFSIEPKWHQRVVKGVAPAFKRQHLNSPPATGSQKANLNPFQLEDHQLETQNQISICQSAQDVVSKIVLDKLDGSFRSGELTAILGPSGAGKTTLLDCLTGHRKNGLSGSIKISSSSQRATSTSPPAVTTQCSNPGCLVIGKCHLHRPISYHHRYASSESSISSSTRTQDSEGIQKNLTIASADQQSGVGSRGSSTADNLKVSIIPQNDHLMGHLTVYETLNYASKMKNCFEKEFDHKLNIKRVAQQLGLMSCLGTRINKLSGGQYKRVSIAQELLSSPDILILDEPTSGLDAMTCYQTVQVLRKLTDDRRASGQKQLAVILTIHQPNSDVFQQFNHVYVVAQGGKCIYEGPPSNIESVINRVGIRLPNSYYNPATMIVEIAAGKFGSGAIVKLNSIQKKQYDFVVPDEQNSTGDSAVDCPSSSSNDDDDDDDDEVTSGDLKSHKQQQNANNNNDDINFRSFSQEFNNNNNKNQDNQLGGLVNRGFIMETEEEKKVINHNSNNNNNNNIVVIVGKVEDNNNNNTNEDIDSVDKIKMMNLNANEPNGDNEGRRKKRRRTRKRSGDQSHDSNNNNTNLNSMGSVLSCVADSSSISGDKLSSSYGCGVGGEGGGGGGGSSREKRLKLNSLKADQKFPFWRHTYLHFHRSWLSIVRDPMLCSMQLALHILVPVMVSLVYGTNVGKPNACPRAGPMDIMAYALEPTDTALQLQEDLRTTLENIGYIFFKLYGIIFAAMTVTVLTFPLDMHVLVKEFRNGWYGLSSYFLGRTLADIPFQLTLPLLAMSLSYYATGQPYSYMQWRFLSITGILILSSLIAQSQGLLFGAILMDRMKAAVFVAPAATTPIILFAGFLVRTQSIPHYLRPLSYLSYLRYAIEACLISRYGFNQCECDPSLFNQTVPELPPIARSMLDYWLSSFKASTTSEAPDSSLNSTSLLETTTSMAETEKPDLFTKLIDSLAKANSFGRNITSCEQVVPYPMIDYDLKDSQLFNCFAILIFTLIFTRLLTFFIVCFKVKRKV